MVFLITLLLLSLEIWSIGLIIIFQILKRQHFGLCASPMWSPIWSLCWLFQFLPLTIFLRPLTLRQLISFLQCSCGDNLTKFLDKLDHFEGRFEKENVSTKKRLAFHSQIMFDVHFFIIFLPQKNDFKVKLFPWYWMCCELGAPGFCFIWCILGLSVTFWVQTTRSIL